METIFGDFQMDIFKYNMKFLCNKALCTWLLISVKFDTNFRKLRNHNKGTCLEIKVSNVDVQSRAKTCMHIISFAKQFIL